MTIKAVKRPLVLESDLESQVHEGETITEKRYEIPEHILRAMSKSAQIGRQAAKRTKKKK